MTPPAWGIPLVLVVGVAVVAFGWWWDRRRARQQARALERPPAGEVPGLSADAPPPDYVTEAQLASLAPPAPSDRELRLVEQRHGVPALPGGIPDGWVDPARGNVVAVDAPFVLVTDAAVVSQRVIPTVLAASASRGRPLVWVAPGFSAEVLGTLRANTLARGRSVLPVVLQDAAVRRRASAMTGGSVVSEADLLADWLPPQAWGRCAGWVADRASSWVVLEPEGDEPRP